MVIVLLNKMVLTTDEPKIGIISVLQQGYFKKLSCGHIFLVLLICWINRKKTSVKVAWQTDKITNKGKLCFPNFKCSTNLIVNFWRTFWSIFPLEGSDQFKLRDSLINRDNYLFEAWFGRNPRKIRQKFSELTGLV